MTNYNQFWLQTSPTFDTKYSSKIKSQALSNESEIHKNESLISKFSLFCYHQIMTQT